MKLSGAVMDAVRGMGGAALIAVVSAGCGASPQQAQTTPVPTTTMASNTPASSAQPKPGTVVVSYPQPDHDMAAACGRG